MPLDSAAPSQELDYEDILDLLPDEVPSDGPNRRKHNLTRSDLALIGRMIEAKSGHKTCQQFTTAEIVIGKRILRAINGAANLIGITILVAIIGFFVAIFSKGFWVRVAEMFK